MFSQAFPSRPHRAPCVSRRDFLGRAGGGFGSLALAALLARETRADDSEHTRPRPSHHPARAKRVIWCFVDGGPSNLDLFDPKPALQRLAGQPLPASFPRPETAMGGTAHTPLLATKRTFKRYGRSGAWLSEWLPGLAGVVDELCFLRGCTADGQTHVGAVGQMNSGSILAGHPSWGAWLLYGLGTEADNLPGYVVLGDGAGDPPGGSRHWGAGFMPALFAGTRLRDGHEPILYLDAPEGGAVSRQRNKLDFIQQLNREHAERRAGDDRLEARIAAYELAYQMQRAAPEAVDLRRETAETRALYGLDDEKTAANARNCLLARRLVERGVRCVQLYLGVGSQWDAHRDVEANHSELCAATDRPVAGLIADLKRRGMLEDTLVVWAGEFGRTPMSESGAGRDHNPFGYTIWMAGGGVRPGFSHGATDEVGLYAVAGKTHVHDLHATILHLLGLDHERLTWLHNGREERLTIVAGQVVKEILA